MTIFHELLTKLCEPFPDNAHVPRFDGHGTYIPIHVYLERLNQVAGEHWSHERVGEPIFYMEDKLAHTIVKVTILNRSHMGEGFSKFQVDADGRIINRHYAIRSATKDAIRDAISFFGIGKSFSNSSKEQIFSSEVAAESKQQLQPEGERQCMKCGKSLLQGDIHALATYKVKFDYCSKHIPKHFKKSNN